ncbi:hypothetical protein SEVIR_2G443650v4 [Setaria viridis]
MATTAAATCSGGGGTRPAAPRHRRPRCSPLPSSSTSGSLAPVGHGLLLAGTRKASMDATAAATCLGGHPACSSPPSPPSLLASAEQQHVRLLGSCRLRPPPRWCQEGLHGCNHRRHMLPFHRRLLSPSCRRMPSHSPAAPFSAQIRHQDDRIRPLGCRIRRPSLPSSPHRRSCSAQSPHSTGARSPSGGGRGGEEREGAAEAEVAGAAHVA